MIQSLLRCPQPIGISGSAMAFQAMWAIYGNLSHIQRYGPYLSIWAISRNMCYIKHVIYIWQCGLYLAMPSAMWDISGNVDYIYLAMWTIFGNVGNFQQCGLFLAMWLIVGNVDYFWQCWPYLTMWAIINSMDHIRKQVVFDVSMQVQIKSCMAK